MLNQTHSDPIRERCATVLLKAVSSFPKLLAQLDPEEAARIVADLIKVQLNLPAPTADPQDALNRIIELASAEVEKDEN